MNPPCDPSIIIRPAQPAEASRLQAIEDAAGLLFRTVGRPEVAQMAPRSEAMLHRSAKAGRLWVACVEDKPVGFALVEILPNGSAHLEELSVDPAYGRRGIGTALVQHVEQAMAARGHATLTLSTFRAIPWNAPWYERLGYRILTDAQLTPALRTVRQHEAELGLAPAGRVLMHKVLAYSVWSTQ